MGRITRTALLVAAAVAALFPAAGPAGADGTSAGTNAGTTAGKPDTPAELAALLQPGGEAGTGDGGGERAEAAAYQSGDDPVGDVPHCGGDLDVVEHDYRLDHLHVAFQTACAVNVATSPNWDPGVTSLVVAIDTDGDEDTEYFIVLFVENGFRAAVYQLPADPAADPVLQCSYQATNDGVHLGATVDAPCFGGASTIRLSTGLLWDENPHGDTCECPLDVFPADWGPQLRRDTRTPTGTVPSTGKHGYLMLALDGGVFAFGDSGFHGSGAQQGVCVGYELFCQDFDQRPQGDGYWIVDIYCNVHAFGAAPQLGRPATIGYNACKLGTTPTGQGYWIVTDEGDVYAFGDASHHGDASPYMVGNTVMDIRATVDGGGYWVLTSDGGVFAFGNAGFFGSTGGMDLNAPVTGMEVTAGGRGYWLVAEDGGVFSFGDAPFFGSTGAMRLNQPVFSMARTPGGDGYWLVAYDGGIFAFGAAPFLGSMGHIRLNEPVVGMAALR